MPFCRRATAFRSIWGGAWNAWSTVARALDRGDRSLAAIALVHAELPALPDADAAVRLAKADGGGRLGKFNQNHDATTGQFSSGPGAAGRNDKKKPWERHRDPALRQKIAALESSVDKPNDGYGEHKVSSGALGRYQLGQSAL